MTSVASRCSASSILLAFKAIESAASFCKLRGNPYVELEHWIHQILQQPGSDLHVIARAFDLSAAALARDVTDALDRLPRGATSVSDLSARVEDATERAWVWATLKFGATSIRTGHLVVAMLKTRELKNALLAISREFSKIRVDELADDFASLPRALTRGVGRDDCGSRKRSAEQGAEVPRDVRPVSRPRLRASPWISPRRRRRGEIDPVVGRDDEIRQIIDILMRRRQNNPILAGEAGVGKTAIVEGLARRIAGGDVPPPLKDVALRALDVGLLQAGASMKGEFEQRLRQIIDEVQSSPKPIVLFIDEVHTLVGAGGAGGHRRRREPAEARARARHVANHRRHDLGRIQEVHRKGSRAHAPFPDREGRRARRRRTPCCMMRSLIARDGEASSRADSRRGARSGRSTLSSLYSRTASFPTKP